MADDNSSKASKEDLKSVQSIRVEKERILALNKQIADLQKSLSQFSNDELQSNKQAIALSERIGSIYEEREKTIQKIRTNREKLKNLDKDELTNSSLRERYIQKQLDASGELLQTQTERRRLSSDELNKISSITDRYDDLVDYSNKLLQNVTLRRDQEESIEGILNIASGLSKAAADAIREGGENAEGFAKATQIGVDAVSSIVDMTKAQDDAQKAALKGEYESVDLTKQQRELKRLNNTLLSDDVKLSDQQRAMLEEAAARLGENIEKAQELNTVYQEISDKVKKTQESQKQGGELLGGMFDKAKSAISRLPLGDSLIKMMKLDSIQSQIETKVGGAFNGFLEGFKNDSGGLFTKFKGGLTGLQEGFGGVGAAGAQGMGAVGGAAQGAMGAATTGALGFGVALTAATAGVTLIIAGVMKLFQLFTEMDKEVSEMGRELGISKKEAIGVYEASADLAAEMNVVGVNAKEIGKGIKTVGESLGGIDVASRFASGNEKVKEMVKNATMLTEKFGMSGEEVSNLQGLSAITGQSVGELSMRATTLGKGIFTAKESMKILASIPKTVAVGMKGNVDAMIKMAQQAKLMGMDMKRIEEIGRGTLEIESSLEAEMEARVLTGKNINLDAMRYYALQGETGKVMEEVRKNAGSLGEFTKMNVVQQEALAKSMNMSREELTEMLTKQEELVKAGLSYDQAQELQAKNSQDLAKLAAETSDEKKRGYIEEIQKQKESEEAAAGFASLMEKIKGLAVKIVAPLMEMVDAFMKGETASTGVLGVIGGIFGLVGDVVKVLISMGKVIFDIVLFPFKLIWAVVSPIVDAVKEIFSSVSTGGGVLDTVAGVFDTISGFISGIHNTIAEVVKIFYTGLLEPGKILWKAILTPIFDTFGKIWETIKGVYGTIMKAFEPLFKANDAAEDTVSFMDTIKKVMTSITPILSIIGDAIGKFIVRPFQMLADLIGIVVKLFTGDFEGALGDLGGLVFDTFIGIPKIIYEAIAGIIDSIFGTNLKESVTGFFDWMKDAFKTVYKLISPLLDMVMEIGGYLIDYLVQPFKSIWGIVEGIVSIFSGDFLGGLQQIGNSLLDLVLSPINLIKDVFSSILDFIVNDLVGAVKNIVPDWLTEGISWVIGGGGGGETKAAEETKKGGSIELPKGEMPQAAAGGTVSSGGLVLVGENGPEIISLPQAATVASVGAGEQAGAILNAMGLGTTTGVEQGGVKTTSDNYEGNQWTEKFSMSGGESTAVGTGGAMGMSGGADNSMAKVEQKLDTLINVISAATTTPTVIKFGDKVVDEIKTQLNFRKAYTGTDIAYGKTLGN
jgi:hypothetical protein